MAKGQQRSNKEAKKPKADKNKKKSGVAGSAVNNAFQPADKTPKKK